MNAITPAIASTSPAALSTYLIVGLGVAPASRGMADVAVEFAGPFDKMAPAVAATATTTADFIAVQRQPIAGPWALEAAALLTAQPDIGAVVVTSPDISHGSDVFAETGAALVVSRRLLTEVGGLQGTELDPLAPGAEADLQWRLAARGYRIAALPLGPKGCFPRIVPLTSRLAVLIENLEPTSLAQALPSLVLTATTDSLRSAGADTSALDLQRSPGGDDVGTLPLPSAALVGPAAVVRLTRELPQFQTRRLASQRTRRVSDRVLAAGITSYLEATSRQCGVTAEMAEALPGWLAPERLRTLIVSSGEVDHEWVSAVTSSLQTEVRLRTLNDPPSPSDQSWADSIILEGVYLRSVPWVASSPTPVLVDLSHWSFTPDLSAESPGLLQGLATTLGLHTELLLETVKRADLLVVGDEEQRDLALGLLAGCGRLTDVVYDEDASLKSIIDELSTSQIAQWCSRPRRAIDLVHTFIPNEPGQAQTALSVAKKLTQPVRRAVGRR